MNPRYLKNDKDTTQPYYLYHCERFFTWLDKNNIKNPNKANQ